MKYLFLLFACICSVLFAAEVEVTLLQTTDTHASLTPTDRKGGKSNYLQLATLIRQELTTANGNAILIDCGDNVQGSITATVSGGMAGIWPIIALPYDVWVPGNHELDFGVDAFGKYCEAAGDKLLCANLCIRGQAQPRGWRMFERNGAHIAVIGMEASFFKHWLLASDYAKLDCRTAISTLEKLLPEITQQKPDAIVLAIHQAWFEGKDKRGVNEVNEIATRFPEIDVILGGHSHRAIPGQRIGLKSWYVQAGALAQHLGVVKLKVDTDAHKVTDIRSSLKLVAENTPEDEQLKLALKQWTDLTENALKRNTGIVLKQPISHEGKPGLGCQTSALLAAAIAEETNADVAFHSKLYDITLYAGKIKPESFFWLVPYENRIVTFDATTEQLEQLMAEQWAQNTSYRYNGPWNMDFSITENGVKLLKIGGKTPEPGHKWRVAINSHAAAGSGAFPLLQSIVEDPSSNTVISTTTTREAVEHYLKKHQDNISIKSVWITKK